MASTARRRRELARRRFERQQERRSRAGARRGRGLRVLGALVTVALIAGGGVLVAGALDDGDDTTATTDPNSVACDYRDTADAAVPGIGLPREPEADAAAPSAATLTIGDQKVEVELFSNEAPCTTRSFAFLAAADYFDDSTCHRLTTADSLKVLQCGDPSGSGSGGPGYEYDDENIDGAEYPAGTLAMANSGEDSNGSQFFLVYDDSDLDPDYTVFGRVTSGLDVLTGIAAEGTESGDDDGAPKNPVTLTDVTTT